MYQPGGFRAGELGDIDVIEHEGRLHLFHLVLPGHDRVAHLESDDGLSWRRLPDALTTGAPGSFDDDQIWTMGVALHDGAFVMQYTALSEADGGRVQRIGVASSPDLVHWTKSEGPVGTADDPRLEGLGEGAPWVAFRDPKPTRVGDRYLTTVCVRARSGPARRRGAIAFFDSDDPRRLGTLRELFVPGRFFELECPQLFEIDGRWFLTASVHDDRSQRYWIGEGPTGPWRTPSDDRLLPAGNYAARAFTFGGQPGLLGWFRDADGIGSLLAPVALRREADGTLVAGGWPHWRGRVGASTPIALTRPDPPRADVTRTWLGPDPGPAFELRSSLVVDAPRWGLSLERDDDGGALAIEVTRDSGELRLVDQRCTTTDDGRPWFSHRLIQAAHHRFASRVELVVRRWGGAIEVQADGRIVLSAAAPPHRGPLALFADSGTIEVASAELSPIASPGD